MTTPLISLLHPTARVTGSEAFPRGWKDAHDAWMARADHPERVEYILAIHESRWETFCNETAREKPTRNAWESINCVQNNKRDCVVDQLNCAAAVSHGALLVGVMDDLYPPEHWDTLLLEALPWHWNRPGDMLDTQKAFLTDAEKRGEFHILCSSGATPERDRELMICGAITRKRWERYGFILDPDFESMFSDNWYAYVARRDEAAGLVKVIERLDIQFDHRHPGMDKGVMDDVYRLQNREQAYAQGQATFLKKAHGTRTLFVCIPGEWFRWEVMWGDFALLNYLNHGMRFLMQPVGAFSTNVHCTRIECAEACLAKVKPDLVLWIDDDNTLTPPQFETLLSDLEKHPELDGIVAWCWCDNDGKVDPETGQLKPWMISCGRQGPNWECLKFTQEDVLQAVELGQLLITSDDIAPDAFWSGFPVVLMRGAVLETLGANSFAPITNPDLKYGFASEDAAFFKRAHDAGLKFAVDLGVQVPHLKFRAIAPQHIPIQEKAQALRARGEVPDEVLSM